MYTHDYGSDLLFEEPDSVISTPGMILLPRNEPLARGLFDMDKWHLVRVGMKWYLVTNIVLVALAWLESITSR